MAEPRELTETEHGALGFILRALQTSEVPFHDDPKACFAYGDGWLEYALFPEGLFRVRVEHITGEPVARPLEPDTPLLDRPISETPVPAETIVTPPIDSDGKRTDTWNLTPGAQPDPEVEATMYRIASSIPINPTPEVVVPDADSAEYHQLFDRMLEVCENLQTARKLEDAGDIAGAEVIWDCDINPALAEVMKLLTPAPVLTLDDWRTAVINDETELGFREWLAEKFNG